MILMQLKSGLANILVGYHGFNCAAVCLGNKNNYTGNYVYIVHPYKP